MEMNNRKYVDRLVNEWIKHKKIVISVDFDDTISPWGLKSDLDKEVMNNTIQSIKSAYLLGAYIVIFTASTLDRYEVIQQYCEEIKLPIACINKNPLELPYGNNGKIFYNINICDRSGLNESIRILEEATYQYEQYLMKIPYTT